MKKEITLCLLFLFSSLGIFAQVEGKIERKKKTKERIEKTASLSAGYFGQGITQPGLKIGLDYPLITTVKRVERYNRDGELYKTKVRKVEYFAGAHIGGFYHAKSETGLLLDVELGRRKVKTKGTKRSFGIGTGVLQTFRNGPTFSTSSTGTGFDQRAAAGQTSWQANIFLALGKDNFFIGRKNMNWEIKYKLLAQFPFGTAVGIRNFFEFSLAYPFDLQQRKRIKV